MKKVLLIALTLVFLLSVVPLTSIPVVAEAPSATCTVTGANYGVGASETYVTADVMFTSETAFTAGMFSVAADDLVFADCIVSQSLGGEDPEINLDLTQNKVMFTGFGFSPDDDIRSYTELTLTLKFTIEGTTLANVEAGTSWIVNITDIDLVNADEDEYEIDGSVGYINVGGEPPHIHSVGDWIADETGHKHHCDSCDQDVDFAPHSYDWVISIPATSEQNGLSEEICLICGYKSGNTQEVPLADHIPGDINNDGSVNNKDLTRLFQYLSEWDVEVNKAALDVNGDGDVNNKDLTRLFQYLSAWDVQIF